jgi:hypothetical protein
MRCSISARSDRLRARLRPALQCASDGLPYGAFGILARAVHFLDLDVG